MKRCCILTVWLFLLTLPVAADPVIPLPGTRPMESTTKPSSEELSEELLAAAHAFIERKIDESVDRRARHWKRDPSSPEAYAKSVEPNRQRLMKCIGVVDPRLPVVMERFGDDDNPALVAECDGYRIYQVRWPVLEGVFGEGLLLEPDGEPVASVVAIPDADHTPEQIVGLAHEYAKVRWLYAQLGLADKTEIEFFNGGHAIYGQGTFEFLRKHLNWPIDRR